MNVPTLIFRKYVIGKPRPMIAAAPVREETGTSIPLNVSRRQNREDRSPEKCRDLRSAESRNQHADAGRRGYIEQCADKQDVRKLPFRGTLKRKMAIRHMSAKLTMAMAI